MFEELIKEIIKELEAKESRSRARRDEAQVSFEYAVWSILEGLWRNYLSFPSNESSILKMIKTHWPIRPSFGQSTETGVNMPKLIFIILALTLSGCLDYSASGNSSRSSNSSNSSGGYGSSSSSISSSVSGSISTSYWGNTIRGTINYESREECDLDARACAQRSLNSGENGLILPNRLGS